MKDFPVTIEQLVVWRDLDALGHVNNAVYATYLENGRMAYISHLREAGGDFYQLILAEVTITFKSPAFLRERLVIGTRVASIKNSSFVVEARIEEKETGRLVVESRGVLVHYDYETNRAKPVPPEWRALIGRLEGRSF